MCASFAFYCHYQTCQPSRFWRDSPAFLPDVPLNHGMSRFSHEVGFFFVTLPRCLDVNANHPIERNCGNSVRFLAKIPNGRATVYFGTQLIYEGCILLLLNKSLCGGPSNRPAFCRQVPLFTPNVPLKTFSRLAGLHYYLKLEKKKKTYRQNNIRPLYRICICLQIPLFSVLSWTSTLDTD